jgi:tRNA 2-thiouridine synthesizing protein A
VPGTAAALQPARVLDARGSFCPGPLMALIGAIKEGKVGDLIEVQSSDQGSRRDIPFWVNKAGHELTLLVEEPGYTRFVVRKKR